MLPAATPFWKAVAPVYIGYPCTGGWPPCWGYPCPAGTWGAGIPLDRGRSGLLHPCRIPGGSRLGLYHLPLNRLGIHRSGSRPFVPIAKSLVHIHRSAAQVFPVANLLHGLQAAADAAVSLVAEGEQVDTDSGVTAGVDISLLPNVVAVNVHDLGLAGGGSVEEPVTGVLLPLLGALGDTIPEGELEAGREAGSPIPLLLAQGHCLLKGGVEPLDGLLVGLGDKDAGAVLLPLLVIVILGGAAGRPEESVGEPGLAGGESGRNGVVAVCHFLTSFFFTHVLGVHLCQVFRRYSTGNAQVM